LKRGWILVEQFLARASQRTRAVIFEGDYWQSHYKDPTYLDMIKIVPAMVRLRSHLSVYSLVSKYIKDESLRTVMSFHPLLVGGNLAIYSAPREGTTIELTMGAAT
jgi:hypothetical protein